MDEENIGFSTVREINCTIHWFQHWNGRQRELFMKDLLAKALPSQVDFLLDAISDMNVRDRPPNIFECQLRLFGQWFEEWSIPARNYFVEKLRSFDPVFISQFDNSVHQCANMQ